MPLLKLEIKLIKPNPNLKTTKIPLFLSITQKQKDINIHINVFYAKIMIFLITKTCKVNFRPVTRLTSKSTTNITNELSSDQTKYDTRGIKITDIHGDNKFNIKALEYFLQPTI